LAAVTVEQLVSIGLRQSSASFARSYYAVTKRLLDLCLALLGLLVLAPMLLVVAMLVRVTSPGPALFRQVRVGKNGRPFTMLKFRSMSSGADDAIHRDYVSRLLTEDIAPEGGAAGVYKLVGDPRVTAVGRLLRKTSIDELPQLMNVVRGHMSLVGPRPALGWEVELYEHRHRRRLAVKPGLTGLWQVSGRSTLTMREALDLDVEYVARRGLGLDLMILAGTVPALLRRSAAA
jgi:lipopolysaccharide/colanic/teichoic acid biosynthesis glycosyltransferase